MKYFVIIFFLIFFYSAFAQSSFNNKYFIYFLDKGIKAEQQLNKNSSFYIQAEKMLSNRAIERRRKNINTGENIITFEDIPIYQPYIDSLLKDSVKIVWKLKWLNAVSCYLNESQINKIKKYGFVKSIEEVKKFVSRIYDKSENVELQKLISTNSDYGLSFEEMNLSDIPVAHNLGITGEGVLIGVMDAGFSWINHPAIKNTKVIDTYDFVYKDKDVSNDGDFAHGSSVLSLIAANDTGNMIAPAYNSEFVLAKTEDIRTEKNVEEDNYAAALEWLESIGVDITTASLGYSEFDSGEFSYSYSDMDGKTAVCTKALEIAFQKGIITINSAGNEGSSSWHYITAPADGFNVITVGAVDASNQVTAFSSRGPTFDGRIKPEVVAYGKSNYVADASKNSYKFGDGTSYSTPLVAGMIAQLLSFYPHLTNRQVRKIIIESGDNSQNPDNNRGYGLLSIKRALNFPNLSNNGLTLNKVFFVGNNFYTGSVKIFYKKSNETVFNSADMQLNNTIYNFDFPVYTIGDTINFYFSFNYNNNNIIEPENGTYAFVYGSSNISYLTKIHNEPNPPSNFQLYQNFPNPFNSTTKIKFDIPATKGQLMVNLKIYDTLGRELSEILNEIKYPGSYELIFDAEKYGLASGTYFLKMKVNDFASVIKLIYLK